MCSVSPFLIAIINKEFTYVYANEAYADLWGKQPEEVVGQRARDLLGPEDFENSLEHFVEAAGGTTVEYEAEYRIDQRTVVLETKLAPFASTAEPDQIDGFYVFSNDVTGKHVSQQALSLILASAPGRICQVNPDYKIMYANRRFIDDYNRSEEVMGMRMSEVIHKSLWDAAKTNIDRAFQGQFVSYREFADKHTWMNTNAVVYLIPDRNKNAAKVNGVYCLIFDEAELELGRQRLRRRERNVDLALQGQMVGIWEADPERTGWLLTEHIEKLLGMAAGELENSESLTFKRIHPDDLPEVLRNRRINMGTGELYVNEFRMQTLAGKYRWFRTIGRAELDSEGKSIYLAGTITDINELKEAELLAAEQVKHRDSFISLLSHELRNPVAAIKYALDVFQRPANPVVELPDTYAQSLAIVSRQTNIIARLLKDLLNVNRISHNQILFENAPVCLVKLCREIVEVSAPKFESKHQRLLFECDVDSFEIFGDEVRLHQVFVNLLDNASKYSPPNTEVRLMCCLDEQTGHFVATVSDRGQGIKAKSQRTIFELFFQEDPTLDRTDGGLGVGLYLVKRIIEAHYGKVSVTSPGINGGSDFEVRLPKKMSNASAPHGEEKVQQLVLVEDNDDSRVALSLALSARGFDVQTFSDGETAALLIPVVKPKIALIDIGLPKMDGISLVKELRLDEELKDSVFIALTGYGQQHEREAIIAAGFHHHLVKPLDLDDLFKIIAQRDG